MVNKSKEKHLLVVSFLEGKNFTRRPKVKFIVEAKFDGEQLATDAVEHQETIEINQELAWELDKKSLQMHRLQRSAIKAICYAVGEGVKENIGYVVLDIRSAPEGIGKPKWYNLLQPKYPKSKPSVQINLYVEEDQPQQLGESINIDINKPPAYSAANESHKSLVSPASVTLNTSYDKSRPRINLIEEQGYFQIERSTPDCQVYVLTITIAFARNLIRLIADQNKQATHFYFAYKFLNNHVSTKPFEDIVSCFIHGERSTIRLNTTLGNLKRFFQTENALEISFCSNDRMLAKTTLGWRSLLEQWNGSSLVNSQNSIVVDYLLKFESLTGLGRQSPMIDVNLSPVLGVQVGLSKEDLTQELLTVKDTTKASDSKGFVSNTHNTRVDETSIDQIRASPIPTSSSSNSESSRQQVVYQNNNTKITLSEHPKETVLCMKSDINNENIVPNNGNVVSQEMQLKAAYEIEMWKEAREKEFEQYLKKLEAKKFQSLADAFKQHDLERETIVQKKLKEYSELEVVLKNSLNEVERREKLLATNEAQVARLKADLHHEYENKLLELREASKRVQEKADHQVHLQKSKVENLEDELSRMRRQIHEWEKRFSDKEAEFVRYREREHERPEIRLQSELNMLNLEKLEMERKLDAMTKARNHYKEQWSKSLMEIANIKKREEANAKAALKKQQMELEHLRLRYLAQEENELIKNDEKQLASLKSELERMKMTSYRSGSSCGNINLESESASTMMNLDDCMDQNLKDHIVRLTEERDTLLRTGVYSNVDAIIVELDKRIRECYKEAKQTCL